MKILYDISDSLAGERFKIDPELLTVLKEFTRKLKLFSDKKSDLDDSESSLFEAYETLRDMVIEPICENLSENSIPHQIKLDFIHAYLLSQLFDDTVGHKKDFSSSIVLKFIAQFRLENSPNYSSANSNLAIYDKFKISAGEQELIETSIKNCRTSIERKRKLISTLKHYFEIFDQNITENQALKAFTALVPFHCFQSSEVNLICTATGLYFVLPDQNSLVNCKSYQRREKAAQKEFNQFLDYIHNTRFEKFTDFPMFGNFDARESEDKLIKYLCLQLNESPSNIKEQLNAAISILGVSSVEKYLIHDTWGHLWQADMTDLKILYDRMIQMKQPISLNQTVQIGNNIIGFSDFFYIAYDGTLKLDEDLQKAFISEYVRLKIALIISPVCAEIGADMIEYIYGIVNQSKLPSSSLFTNLPAKLDFAWNDLRYFCRELTIANLRVHRSSDLRNTFTTELKQILAQKYSHHFENIYDPSKLEIELTEMVDRFFEELTVVENYQFNQELPVDQTGNINGLAALTANLFKLQFQINDLFKNHLEKHHSKLMNLSITVIIFLIKNFEKDPLHQFWNLDENIANYAIPMLQAISDLHNDSDV